MQTYPNPASYAESSYTPPFEAVWTALHKRLIQHARMVVHEPALPEDLAQETLMSVLEDAGSHRDEASITSWAAAILQHKIADWYRSPHQCRRTYNASDEDDADPTDGLYDEQGGYLQPVPVWQQPDSREAQRQVISTLEACLRRLPIQTGRVFMMREWLGSESSEFCEPLGLTAENCRKILHRARGLTLVRDHLWPHRKDCHINLFHSCERAAELMSQAQNEPLDRTDQMRRRIHLSMYGNCQEVEKQMATLHELAPQLELLDLGMTDELDPPANVTR